MLFAFILREKNVFLRENKHSANTMNTNDFSIRHIGNNAQQAAEMLSVIGKDSIDSLIEATVPQNIRLKNALRFTRSFIRI